ncbi:hypothetical protein PC123_g27088 [Phytophthora cactorum]|nr:hypothetical protein PC123_g27088 [Phytophthora cactorum]
MSVDAVIIKLVKAGFNFSVNDFVDRLLRECFPDQNLALVQYSLALALENGFSVHQDRLSERSADLSKLAELGLAEDEDYQVVDGTTMLNPDSFKLALMRADAKYCRHFIFVEKLFKHYEAFQHTRAAIGDREKLATAQCLLVRRLDAILADQTDRLKLQAEDESRDGTGLLAKLNASIGAVKKQTLSVGSCGSAGQLRVHGESNVRGAVRKKQNDNRREWTTIVGFHCNVNPIGYRDNIYLAIRAHIEKVTDRENQRRMTLVDERNLRLRDEIKTHNRICADKNRRIYRKEKLHRTKVHRSEIPITCNKSCASAVGLVVKYLVANEMPRDCPGLLDGPFGVSRAWYVVSDRLCGSSFDTGEACTWCMGGRFMKPPLVPTAIVDATMDVGIGGQQLLDSDGACCAWYIYTALMVVVSVAGLCGAWCVCWSVQAPLV